MAAYLTISQAQYTLSLQHQGQWQHWATLSGGADAIIPGHAVLSDAVLERAIDVAEGWIMPHAKGLRGETLYVNDALGDVKSGLRAVLLVNDEQFTVHTIEDCFLRVVDLATGRSVSPLLNNQQKFVAHLVLLRELAHHGGPGVIHLVSGRASAPMGAG